MYRIGTTSYIIPADILPNVRYLAPLVDDIQLVLFETDEYGSNLPDAGARAELAAIAGDHGITYSVHLPLDLRLADDGSAGHVSLVKARRVVDATRDLSPYAYTLHLDGRQLPASPTPAELGAWRERAEIALRVVAGWLDEPARLCVENIEAWDPAAFAPLIDALPISRTVDIGHLWLRGDDPLDVLPAWLPRARMIHLHGVDGRDHKSLAHVPAAQLDPVVACLDAHFTGVVCLEIFSEDDLRTSLAALRASQERLASVSKDGKHG